MSSSKSRLNLAGADQSVSKIYAVTTEKLKLSNQVSDESSRKLAAMKLIYANANVSKRSSGDGKKTVVGTRDAESLAEELRFLRKVASDLRTEKRQLGCKIKSLEEDMKRKDKRFQELLEVNASVSKPGAYDKVRDGETLIKKLKLLIRDKNNQLKKLETELEEAKSSIRFTRVNELEKEVKKHFRETLKLKRILEHQKADVPLLNFGDQPGQSFEFAEREKVLIETKAKLRASQEQVSELQDQMQRLKEEYSLLKLEQKSVSDKNRLFESEIAELNSALEEQRHRMTQMEDNHHRQTQKYQKETLKVLEERSNEINSLHSEKREAERACEELELQVKQFNRSLEAKEADLRTKDERIKDSERTVIELQTQLKEMEKQNQKLEKTLKNQTDKQRAETEAKLNSKIEMLKSEIEVIQRESQQKSETIQSLHHNIGELKSEIHSHHAQMSSEIKNTGDKFQSHSGEIQRQKETLDGLLQTFKNRDAINNSKITELEKQIASLQQEKAHLTMDLVRAKSVNSVLSKSLAASRPDLDEEENQKNEPHVAVSKGYHVQIHETSRHKPQVHERVDEFPSIGDIFEIDEHVPTASKNLNSNNKSRSKLNSSKGDLPTDDSSQSNVYSETKPQRIENLKKELKKTNSQPIFTTPEMSQFNLGSALAEKTKSKSQITLEYGEPKLTKEQGRLRSGNNSNESLQKNGSKKSLKALKN